jgi:signal transduction histidine kinase
MALLQQSLLDAVIRQMPAGVMIADAPTGRLIAVNASVHTIWRRDPPVSSEIHEYAAYEGFRPDGTAYLASEWPLARAILRGEVVHREEIRIRRGDGTFGVIRVDASPVQDDRGVIVAAVTTFIDVTDDRRERDSLAVLAAASTIIGESLESNETLRRLAGLAVPSFADFAFVYLLGEDNFLHRSSWSAARPEHEQALATLRERFPAPTEAMQAIIASGRAELKPRLTTDDWALLPDPEQRKLLTDLGIASAINVPLYTSVRTYGVMSFARVDAGPPYDEDDLVLAEELGRRAAAALERSAFFETERAHRVRAEISERRIANLQSLTAALASAMAVADVADRVTQLLERVIGARGIVLALRDDHEPLLRVIRTVGLDENVVEQFREMRLDSGLPLPEAVVTGTPIWKRNREEMTMHAPVLSAIDTPSRSWAAIPLNVDGHAIGAIGFSFSEERRFDNDEQNFLIGIAGQCAIAIARARLFDSERHTREEAERASRAKDEFLAILSHELRTPMTTVIGWADFLKMTHSHDPELAAPIDALRNSARLQAKLVDDLLDVSRIIANKLTIRSVRTELNAIVHNAVEDVLMTAREKGVAVLEELGVDDVPIVGDPDRLRQIVTNLLVNAIKFTPAAGRVTVSVRDGKDMAELKVRDTGEGISPEFLPHVFDRFRQASVGDSRRHAGLGLGLSIGQHLVELHGGTVTASSPGLGKGATFTICLPKRS